MSKNDSDQNNINSEASANENEENIQNEEILSPEPKQSKQNIQKHLMEALEKEVEKYKDNWVRAVAETENIRRRAALEIKKAQDYSIESLARDLIEVTENLFRASDSISEEAAASNEFLKNAKDGIEITKKNMLIALERHNIKRLSPVNEQFDPNLHQAVMQVKNADLGNGIVTDVIQAGYSLKGRVLKPAMVCVVNN